MADREVTVRLIVRDDGTLSTFDEAGRKIGDFAQKAQRATPDAASRLSESMRR